MKWLSLIALWLVLLPGTSTAQKTFRHKTGVPILVFHRIGTTPLPPYRVSIRQFHRILEALKAMDFCPVGLDQIIAASFPEACRNKKLVSIVFDDAHPSQLEFLPDSTLDSNCATAILMSYFPDARATYFINTNNGGTTPFGKDSKEKIEFLRRQGMMVASHSAGHHRLDHLTVSELKKELGAVCEYLNVDSTLLAYPYGIGAVHDSVLINGFEYNQRFYRIPAGFTQVDALDTVTTDWQDSSSLVYHLCPLGNSDDFIKRRYDLPRINITSYRDVLIDVIRNPYVFRFTPDSSLP